MNPYRRTGIVVAALFLVAHLNLDKTRAEYPKAAARAMGDAGRTTAAAVPKDPASASKVPGYAGTNVSERSLGAADLEDAAARALADPDDPGGRAGRAVTRGVSVREKVRIETDDPVSVRGDEVQGDPAAPHFKASGLASGSVTDCGAGLAQAEAGGSCGSVAWCVGADCETRTSQAGTGFVGAAARLNMVLELGGEEFDRGNLLFFPGRAQIVPDPLGRTGELLQGLGHSHRPRRLHRGGAPPGAGTPRREHALPGHAVREAHIRRLCAP